jgi:hypothetical protein
MEAASTSETLVGPQNFYRTTRRHKTTLHNHRCENLKCNISLNDVITLIVFGEKYNLRNYGRRQAWVGGEAEQATVHRPSPRYFWEKKRKYANIKCTYLNILVSSIF